ncbi:MAG TPA: phospholipase D family protein [Xanthomonadaceae bacterium]|nr:phospholipase D family protein [Xanthomonadaceae bacterium]
MLRLVPAALVLAGTLSGCGPSRMEIRRAVALAEASQSTQVNCERADACALASPLRELAEADRATSREHPRHHVLLLESGEDALLSRIHLIRAAQDSIDLQSFIYVQDDAGLFILHELLEAARRGVRVRVLLDQLFSFDDPAFLAELAQQHANFRMRLYNPTFRRARTNPFQFAAGIACCFTRFNQRMHNKLLLVDGSVGITGGRNYQNRYFDWDPAFNFRDRDVLVTGPVARQMQDSFEVFWQHPESVPIAELKDVAALLLDSSARSEPPPPAASWLNAPAPLTRSHRMLDLSAQAQNAALIRQRFVAPALPVAGPVQYVSDLPNKDFEPNTGRETDLSGQMRTLVAGARERIVLQTPYLVLSRPAREVFAELDERDGSPRVVVSTNSLASTDAFPAYALSHKYKRTYLRDLGFDIYEYKPFPADAPVDVIDHDNGDGDGDGEGPLAEGVSEFRFFRFYIPGSPGSRRDQGPVPLEQAGMRIGLHAKSLVVDEEIALVGTHNFDPRSDRFNTESALLVRDRVVAAALVASIERDIAPGNSWAIAPRPELPMISGLNYSVGKLFEQLPLFDFWPWRYATSWEFRADIPDCEPVPRDDARFEQCYEPVGDFPGVALDLKSIYTRILTAFGAGLAPVL